MAIDLLEAVNVMESPKVGIEDIISENDADMMFISETWIKGEDCVKITEMVPNGYDILHIPRDNRSGGGVAIIYKLCLQITTLPSVSTQTFEICSLKVKTQSSSIHCSCVYRPTPGKKNNTNFTQFLSDFNIFIETLTSNDNIYIFGDFNIHCDNSDDPAAQKFKKLLDEHSLKQLVTAPTHIKGHILDLIITRDFQYDFANPCIHDLCLSDHYLLSLSIPFCKQKNNIKFHTY